MVGQRQSPISEASYLRKIRKPLIERKRRERMNNSLNQLKSLLAATIKQHTSPHAKLDKADILDLTVRHLTQLQQQQTAVTMATGAASYTSGFKDCAKETIDYLTSTRLMNDTSVCNLSNHLQNSFLVKTGNPATDQLYAYQAPGSQTEHSRDCSSTDGHSEVFMYTPSSYHGYYGKSNCQNINTNVSDVDTTDKLDNHQGYKVMDCSLAVAPLVQDEDTVWRPW